MPDFKNLSDSLKMEVLAEMAGTYFGARRDLDHMLERFDLLTDQLAVLARTVERHAGLLHFLLLEERGAAEFYQALGIRPQAIPFLPSQRGYKGPISSLNLPLALTQRGRWLKSVRRAYKTYREIALDYMHGHMEPDPQDRRRKRTSVHFEMLQSLAEHINKTVLHVNKNLRLSDALEYARGLEPLAQERERLAGAGQYHEQRTGQDIDFEPIDFEGLTLKPMPDLPEPKEAWRMARSWLKGFYRINGEEIRARMKVLKRGKGRVPASQLVRFRGPKK